MTEILLEVTTEEIRAAAVEASQRAKGKYNIAFIFIILIVKLQRQPCCQAIKS